MVTNRPSGALQSLSGRREPAATRTQIEETTLRHRTHRGLNGLAVIALLAVAALAFACSSVDTSVKLSTDEDGEQTTETFAPRDTIYAITEVDGAAKVTASIVAEDVTGVTPGPTGLENTQEGEESAKYTFNVTPPNNGWPAGRYRLEIRVENDDGTETRSATFSVR